MFCPLPWIHLAIRNNGDLRVCCQANQGPDKGLLRKDDGNIYNAKDADFTESRNCQKMKDIRKSFLNNEWHPDCLRCQREEASNMNSRFSYEKKLWNHYIREDDIKNKTNKDGSIDVDKFKLAYYDLRFGNKCNLKCRICGPTDSSSWYGDSYKLWGDTYDESNTKMKIIKIDGKYQVENNIYEWYKADHFWSYMEDQIPNIQLVYMVGGEPLLIDEHFKFLETCIERGHSNIKIEYNSNISYIPSKAWNIWNKFKKIHIGVSMDGYNKVNEYIRYPSKWSVIEENLNKLNEAKGNFLIWLTCTVNSLNILHLPEFFEWKINQNFKNIGSDWQPIASLHPLHSPHFLNIKIFPLEVKQKIKEHFDRFTFNKYNKEAKELLNHYLNFMFKEDYSDSLPKFFYYNNKLDEIRNQKLEDYIPDLYNLIKGY